MNRVYVAMQEELSEPEWFDRVEAFVHRVLGKLNYEGKEVSILLCNDSYMRQLNNNYRHIDSATDVLSFENDEEYEDEEGRWLCIGDIVISLDTLPVNADYFEEDSNNELKRLLIHGLLHLSGMDHGEEHIEKGRTPQCEMLVLQEKLLQELKDEILIK